MGSDLSSRTQVVLATSAITWCEQSPIRESVRNACQGFRPHGLVSADARAASRRLLRPGAGPGGDTLRAAGFLAGGEVLRRQRHAAAAADGAGAAPRAFAAGGYRAEAALQALPAPAGDGGTVQRPEGAIAATGGIPQRLADFAVGARVIAPARLR